MPDIDNNDNDEVLTKGKLSAIEAEGNSLASCAHLLSV